MVKIKVFRYYAHPLGSVPISLGPRQMAQIPRDGHNVKTAWSDGT